VERAGGWGRHLPLVDDLLSTGLFKKKSVALVGSTGTTTLTPPSTVSGRLRGWMSMTFKYAELSELRRRALESEEPATQVAFVNEVAKRTGISIGYTPHTFTTGEARHAPRGLQPKVTQYTPEAASGKPAPAPPAALALAPIAAVDWQSVSDFWRDLVSYATSPHGNRLPHLAAYVTVTLGAFLVRGIAVRRAIEHDRDAIPLVIGGWGTRGKSGTERLKAALFQGLGHECLVKTTGCEAMFIHAMPGAKAREIFIYRPYDKATVWEQRNVLALARSLGVRVFLWECMALQPDLVSLLQSQWMRDDYSTITNAYPDHEDVQGPSGYDVATVISEFVPTKGNLLTAEDQMLPILRERSKERGTTMRICHPRDADLIGDDMLARFPYAEHPRNIALVQQLARALGVPGTVALAEMADHVVPDLGVLKEYAKVPHRGRTLSFVNGMSANERTAALGNWIRTGFADHDPDEKPNEWTVTVVNNRGDRVARSEVFARFIVEDIAAHRHVLIGTNVRGLRAFIDEALDKHLTAISPTYELAGDGTERLLMARGRLERAFEKLKIKSLERGSVEKELLSLGVSVDHTLLDKLLEPSEPGERYESALEAVDEGLPGDMDVENRPFVVAAIARRRAVRGVHAILGRDLGANPLAVDAAFARVFKAIFAESIITLEDPNVSGDKILDVIAENVPKGVHARIMGCQNIKGTGLDFVYRWVSIDAVDGYLQMLESPIVEKREEALRAIAMHGDYGLLDARNALQRVQLSRDNDPQASSLPYDVAIARLTDVVARREKKLNAKRVRSAGEMIRGAIGRTFDYLDATRRRRMATELLEALITGRLSHAAAAKKMRDIVARAKGGWLNTQTA
jgi:gamma-polyglutamate synthase